MTATTSFGARGAVFYVLFIPLMMYIVTTSFGARGSSTYLSKASGGPPESHSAITLLNRLHEMELPWGFFRLLETSF